jgi:hypothetical protein
MPSKINELENPHYPSLAPIYKFSLAHPSKRKPIISTPPLIPIPIPTLASSFPLHLVINPFQSFLKLNKNISLRVTSSHP